jgi:hypothetical protein
MKSSIVFFYFLGKMKPNIFFLFFKAKMKLNIVPKERATMVSMEELAEQVKTN